MALVYHCLQVSEGGGREGGRVGGGREGGGIEVKKGGSGHEGRNYSERAGGEYAEVESPCSGRLRTIRRRGRLSCIYIICTLYMEVSVTII